MRIDAHNHFWNFDPVRDAWISDEMAVLRKDYLPDEFSSILNRHTIDGAIAVQADQSEQETTFLLGLAEEFAQIVGVVGWVDLQAANINEQLEKLSTKEKLVGFRHIVQAEPDENFMLRKAFLHGISCLAKFDFTYDILIFPNQLAAAQTLVERNPRQPFVIDHMAKPYISKGLIDQWRKDIEMMASYSNVMCKLSGMITEADWKNWQYEQLVPYLDVVVNAFGTDRIMFGSDWPVCLLAGDYARVIGIMETYFNNFSESEKAQVFGENAAKFYSIQ